MRRTASLFITTVNNNARGGEAIARSFSTGNRSDAGTSKSFLAGQSVISASQFDASKLEELFEASKHMRNIVETKGGTDLLKNKVLGNLFYEASTRTSSSFHAAMLRLGGGVVPVNSVTSSVQKGETLADTIRVMENYVDIIVLRHPEIGSAALASLLASVPVINSGDGSGEHPTQALLDMFLMNDKFGKISGLTVTMVGDLKYGRTVHSLSQLLAHYNTTMNFVSPKQLVMPREYITELKKKNPDVKVQEYDSLDTVISQTDVLYITRVQKERFSDLDEYNRVKDAFIIKPDLLKKFKKSGVVLHPLPRLNEIDEQVDVDSRAMYFKQPKYGMYLRMALLAGVLGKL